MNKIANLNLLIMPFARILVNAVPARVSEEPYCRRNLEHILEHRMYYLKIYADAMQKLLHHAKTNAKEMVLLDYGSGNGMLGLFAKFCGFKKVFINDIDPNFIHSAKELSAQIGVEPDGYISGEMAEVHKFFSNGGLDAIAGTDVIEHIYDLSIFFEAISRVNPKMITAFTTASNADNYFKVRQLKKLQIKDELEGGIPFDSFGDRPVESYLATRKKLIAENFPSLSENEINKLSIATRGKIKKDIFFAADRYLVTGKCPPPLPHPTNTCNPISGNWCERILSRAEYKEIYKNAGFSVAFYPGFYNGTGKGPGNYLKKMLNAGTTIFGTLTAPYITIIGESAASKKF